MLLEVNSVDRSDGDDDYTKHNSQMNKSLVIKYFNCGRDTKASEEGLCFESLWQHKKYIAHLQEREETRINVGNWSARCDDKGEFSISWE